jgi:hypothetical protein
VKQSNKSDKIQEIIDEWSVNYIGMILWEAKKIKKAQTASFIN